MLKSRADCPHAFCPDENQLMALTQGLLNDDEVRQLDNVLDQCTHCAELMVALAQDLHPYNNGDFPEPDTLPPVAIGRYNVKSMLGSGGMGVIYEAYDEENQRPVALKLIRPDVLDPFRREAHRARMLREARLLASLHHPNIPNIYEVGTWNDQVFLAMQLVSGTNMRQWLDQANPDWTDIVAAYLRAGEGVVAAHNANIVHRDIKPDNILVEDTGSVYITDFGLARLDQATISSIGMHSAPHRRPPDILSLTGTGDILGTPAYMPPEQYKGQGVSKRSDQFSFCVSLYEALYGMRPFAGQTMEELIQAAQDGRVFRPRFSEIPDDVLQVLIRGMHPVPRERYGSMRELLTALDNAMYQTGNARPRFRSGAIAATILFLIGMLLFLVWGVDNLPFSSWNGTAPASSSLKQQATNEKTRLASRSSNQTKSKAKRKALKSKWLPKSVQFNPTTSVFVRKGIDGTTVTTKNLGKTLRSTRKTKRRRRRRNRRWKKRRWKKRRYRKRRRRRRHRRRFRKNKKKTQRRYDVTKG